MKIISRYVLKEGAFLFAISLAGLTLIFLVIDFFDRIQRYAGKEGAPISLSLLYFLFKLPEIIYQMAPMTALFAGILTLTVLSRSSELVAIRAGGISLMRACYPLLIGAAFLSIILILSSQYIIPFATNLKQGIYYQIKAYGKMKKTGADKPVFNARPSPVMSNWQRGDGYVFFVRGASDDHKRLYAISIFELDDDMKLSKRYDALAANWTGNSWEGENVITRDFEHGSIETGTFDSLKLPLKERPGELTSPEGNTEDLRISELYAIVQKYKERGLDPREYVVEMHSKIAYSLSAVILMLLALPLGVKGTRSGGGSSFGIVLAVIFGVLYWAVFAQATSLGKAGALNPVLSAWAANILFGLIGITIFKGIDYQ